MLPERRNMAISEFSQWLGLLILISANYADAFNVDTNTATRVIHSCSRTVPKCAANSMFGYSVDMYKNSGNKDLLIGAPRDQTNQPGVKRGGSVYKCSGERSGCSQIPFDTEGDDTALNGTDRALPIDSKSDQWFGSFIASSRHEGDDSVIACAPMHVWFGPTFARREPTGNCIVAKHNFRDKLTFSPCKVDQKWGFHRHGYCQAGFSAAIGSDNNVFISAPGAYYWSGSIISQYVEHEGQFTHTKENPKEHDNQLLGYSTASGEFTGDTLDDVVVGVPRGNNLTGMIALYDNTLRNLENISCDQVGSYFGAAVAVTDLNGDGLDDIIVGAPLYTKMERSSAGVKMSYEIGRVYVYFQDEHKQIHRFDKSISVFGQREWGKFGYDVSAAGDLNLDGYNDFIVGAPYDTKQGEMDRRSGAVYIFNGRKEGIHEKFSQVIYGQSIEANIETFGFSVSGGKDTDDNGYPDILVGAYKSNSAILLRSRPVVAITGELRLRPNVIKLEDKDGRPCNIVENVRNRGPKTFPPVSCTTLSVCLAYHGHKLPDELTMKVVISLDVNKKTETRARFWLSKSPSETVIEEFTRDQKLGDPGTCRDFYIYVEDTIRDKLSPISIHVNYSVDENSYRTERFIPVVDSLTDGSLSTELKIWKDCKNADKCIPNLQISSLKLNQKDFNVGSDDRFVLTALVKNLGELAFEAKIFVYTPKGIDFENATDARGLKLACTKQVSSSEYENYDVTDCDLDNPMRFRGNINATMQFSTLQFEGPYGFSTIRVKVNSTNNESTSTIHDNSGKLDINFSVALDWSVSGTSDPSFEILVNTEKFKSPGAIDWEDDIGVPINHTYSITNTGTSTFAEMVVDIYFPSHTYDGEPLLYLIDNLTLLYDTSDYHCELKQEGNINPNQIGIYRNIKSRPKRQVREDKPMGIGGFSKLVDDLKKLGNNVDIRDALYGRLKTLNFDCYDMDCTHWTCTIRNMLKGYNVDILIESYLWTSSLIKEGYYGASASSVMIAKINKLPHKYRHDLPIKHVVVTTNFRPLDPSKTKRAMPWWLILVAVLAGVALLVLLILSFWRCGFFKRSRPPREQALLGKPTESEYYGYSTYSPAAPNYPTHGAQPYGQRL